MTDWSTLAASTLARQFPPDLASADAAAAVQAVGPVQSQTARSPFLALAARMPGVTHADIVRAYETFGLVRGSTLRGTVHTCAAADHPFLEVATRVGQRSLYARALRLDAMTLEEVWEALEVFALDQWRAPSELSSHLVRWLARHDPGATPRLSTTAGRYFGFGHGGLIRRPLSGGWESQGKPGYRAARALLGDRRPVLADVPGALTSLVRRHLAAHGPASRFDVAWWSGLGLREVDAALDQIGDELRTVTGPDGRSYHQIGADPVPADPGVRLLPEFDALLCAYHPASRVRFVAPEHYRQLWHGGNGLLAAPLLVDGRLTGWWRMAGAGQRRACEVSWFSRTRRPTRSELADAMAAIELALPVRFGALRLERVVA